MAPKAEAVKVAKAPKEKAEKAVKAPKAPKEKKEKVAKAPKEKKAKAPKDPNAPKRGLGAYMFFCKDKRDELKVGVEGGVAGVAKVLGAAWKELSDDDKEQYTQQANKDKARYIKEKAAYDAKGGKPAAAGKAAAPAKKAAAAEEEDEEDGEEEEEDDEDDE